MPSYIVILRSFSSRVFHFFFSEELSVTNQVPKSIEIARRINFIIFVHRQTENLSRVIEQNSLHNLGVNVIATVCRDSSFLRD